MLKIDSSIFKEVVHVMVSGAKRSRLAQGYIFVQGNQNELTLSIIGEIIQLRKVVPAEVQTPFEFVTTVQEIDFKTRVLPDEETLSFEKVNGGVLLKWGRASKLAFQIFPESIAPFMVPDTVSEITWPTGKIQAISRMMGGFPALINSDKGKEMPVLTGIHFSKTDVENEVVVQASNSIRAIRYIDLLDWFEGDIEIAIPSEAINSLAELIQPSQQVTIGITENRSLFVVKSGGVTAVIRVMNDKFPDISRLLSDENAPNVWRADRMELLAITRRIRYLGSVMKIFGEGSKVYAELEGVLQEQIGAIRENGTENFSVVAENIELSLLALRSEEVLLSFEQKNGPLSIFSGDEDTSEKLVIMTAQIKED